jgi:(2Fe-2S) ferredoxin
MGKPKKHVFVCTQSRPEDHPRGSCAAKGSGDILQEFKQEFEKRQLWGRYAVAGSTCLGTCGTGPSVLVYPEGVMYGNVSKEDVAAIIEEHLLGDKPVERLQLPEVIWG